MRSTLRLVVACTVLPVCAAVAQVQYSVGNLFRFGNGTQVISGLDQRKEYVENQSNVRLYWKDFTVGFQYLYDDPPEFGPTYVGMKKRYVEYLREGLELRAGDFYTLYDRGLTMNLFENRGLNYDTGLDGFRAVFNHEWFDVLAALGTMKYHDLLDPTYVETYSVRSGHIELKPLSFLRVGGSLVGVSGRTPARQTQSDMKADILGCSGGIRLFGFDLFAEYARKHSYGTTHAFSLDVPYDKTGEGWYGSLSFTGLEGFGLTFEYKNYRFDVVDPDARKDVNRPTRVVPVQNPPIVHKEHAFTLLTRSPHTIDFNDETGWQVDVFSALLPNLVLNMNGAVASRQQSWVRLPGGRYRPLFKSNDLFPALDDEFSPFWEVYLEAEWYFEEESFVRLAVNRRSDTQYEEGVGKGHRVASTTLPVRIEYMLDKVFSLGVSLEQQWASDNSYPPDARSFFNEFVSVTLAHAPNWAATIRAEFTSDTFDPSGKQRWVTGEFTYRLGNVHTATVSYGSERGGLICSSGVCRVVQPFTGVRVQLYTQL